MQSLLLTRNKDFPPERAPSCACWHWLTGAGCQPGLLLKPPIQHRVWKAKQGISPVPKAKGWSGSAISEGQRPFLPRDNICTHQQCPQPAELLRAAFQLHYGAPLLPTLKLNLFFRFLLPLKPLWALWRRGESCPRKLQGGCCSPV